MASTPQAELSALKAKFRELRDDLSQAIRASSEDMTSEYRQEMERLKEELKQEMKQLPDAVAQAISENFSIEGIAPLTQVSMERAIAQSLGASREKTRAYFQANLQGVMSKLDDILAPPVHNPAAQELPSQEDEDEHVSAEEDEIWWKEFTWGGRFDRTIPEDFDFTIK